MREPMDNRSETIMCPAHLCKQGSQLLGVRQNDGTTVILPQTLPVDDAFVKKVRNHPVKPERRFRFTNKCIEKGCEQWNEKGCSVGEKLVRLIESNMSNETLPACPIRKNCRWFVQEGAKACVVCPQILTEVMEENRG